MLGLQQVGAQNKCDRCKKHLPLGCFATHVVKGEEKVYTKCEMCRPKHAKSNNTSSNRAENTKRFQQSEKGKANQKRARQSDKGKAAKKRELETKKKRLKEDPAYAMMGTIASLATRLVSGRQKNSPTFVARTSFKSEADFIKHIRREAAKRGWTLADYGTKFQIEHKIPQEAFDFSDPEDVKHCWSHSNVHVMTPEENMEKSWFIIDEMCLDVRVEKYPKSWAGRIPTEEEKKAFYAKCLAALSQAGPSDAYASDEAMMDENSDSD
jgi:hypothetical protein